MKTSGQVTFTDLGNGETQITVLMQYIPPGGAAGDIAGKLFSNPEKRLEEDLQNFKSYLEEMPERTPLQQDPKQK